MRYYIKHLDKTDNDHYPQDAFILQDIIMPISENYYEGEMYIKVLYIHKHSIKVNSLFPTFDSLPVIHTPQNTTEKIILPNIPFPKHF